MIERGSAFLLKVGDGAATPTFATVAGLRTTQLSVNGEAVVVTSKDSGGWRQLLSGAGVRSVSVSGAGVFTGSAAEARLRASALSLKQSRFDRHPLLTAETTQPTGYKPKRPSRAAVQVIMTGRLRKRAGLSHKRLSVQRGCRPACAVGS